VIYTPAAKYWAIFKTQVSNRAAYASDMLAGSLSILLYVWIFIQLWRATYTATGQTVIAGLTLKDMLWYLMLTETIVLSKPRLSRLVSEAVKDGSVAYLLNKPYNFLLYQLSVGLGDSLLSMAFNLLAGGALVWLMVGAPPDPRGWPLVLAAMLLGWLIDFCFQAIIGLTAFVTEEISAFEWIYQKTLFILGGMLIPLDFFPGWLRTIAQALPFAYTVYGPARLFVEPSLARFGLLVLGQAVWLGVMGVIVSVLYRQGMKRLTINGG
jgi:ABC-2 type transport system permease protein